MVNSLALNQPLRLPILFLQGRVIIAEPLACYGRVAQNDPFEREVDC
jgi:hypothetical protein